MEQSRCPSDFCPRLEVQAVLCCLAVLCVWCTAVSPTCKQQLPVWLRLDCKCQQTKEDNSRFISISSSTVSWYFSALQVLIEDLAIRNLREGFRAGSSSAAWVYQIKCNSTDIPELPTNHRGDSSIATLAEFFTWQRFSSWWRTPELLWQCSQGMAVQWCFRESGQNLEGCFLRQGEWVRWSQTRDSAVLSTWSTKPLSQR